MLSDTHDKLEVQALLPSTWMTNESPFRLTQAAAKVYMHSIKYISE